MFDRLWKALDDRFTDIDECHDISTHGCEMGVGGFIYHHELKDFYFEHEDDIEELLNDHNVDYEDLIPSDRTTYSVRDCIQYSVWYAVLIYCEERAVTHQPVAV
jgi:hypothetical protein